MPLKNARVFNRIKLVRIQTFIAWPTVERLNETETVFRRFPRPAMQSAAEPFSGTFPAPKIYFEKCY
jgi:hypothetical protein